MHVPRIWERQSADAVSQDGVQFSAVAWGWSESDPAEANARALESATRIVRWLASSREVNEPNQYGYDERLPREEIIDEYADANEETHAFVSRNGYGALILNTRDLVFIDIDLPPKPRPVGMSLIGWLLGKKKEPVADPADGILSEIRSTALRYPDLDFRVYRTFNGFRVMVTNQLILPDSDLAQELLTEFKSDPLYVRMCSNQQCFRARLTPKAFVAEFVIRLVATLLQVRDKKKRTGLGKVNTRLAPRSLARATWWRRSGTTQCTRRCKAWCQFTTNWRKRPLIFRWRDSTSRSQLQRVCRHFG